MHRDSAPGSHRCRLAVTRHVEITQRLRDHPEVRALTGPNPNSLLLILLVAASCGKEGGGNGPQGGSGAAGPIAASGRNPRDDYSKPYLTDQKVEKLLVAMKDGDNPPQVRPRSRGNAVGQGELQGRHGEARCHRPQVRVRGITGNKGYIDKNLEKHLSDKGFWIGGFDKKTGICAASFRLPKKSDIFAIIHLAATSGIEECNKDIEETIKNYVIAASNMFLVALENDIPIIFISSQAAKDHNSSVYAASKYYAECYASYYNLQGAKIRILRLSNVYGGIDYIEKMNSVVAKYLKAKIEGRSLIVNGDGSQVLGTLAGSLGCFPFDDEA